MAWNKKTEKSEYKNANETGGGAATPDAPPSAGSQGTPATPPPSTPDAGGWQKVENRQDGTFFTFAREGEELVGTWQGDFEGGKNQWGNLNHNGKVLTSQGLALVTLNANLFRQLESVVIGKEIRIKFLGKKLNKTSGNYYKDFEVSVKV